MVLLLTIAVPVPLKNTNRGGVIIDMVSLSMCIYELLPALNYTKGLDSVCDDVLKPSICNFPGNKPTLSTSLCTTIKQRIHVTVECAFCCFTRNTVRVSNL